MVNEEIDQFRQFVESLKEEANRTTALNEIKNFLSYKIPGEAAGIIKNVGISKIVKCLNMKEKSHVDLTCEVLKMCFEKLDVGEAVIKYTSHIMYLLRHEKPCVRKLAVDEVYKATTANPDLLPVPQYIDVFVAVSHLVADEDVGIANKAILITSHLPMAAYPRVLEFMKMVLDYGTSAKCNAYEVVTNISSNSSELLALSAEHGYIDHMLSELNSDDVLYQLNILELLSRLAVKPHGIRYFVEHSTLQQISQIIDEQKNRPLANLLQPGYMKFFGCIAHLYPKEVFAKYPVILNSLFDALDSGDQAILPVALDTLGFIGATVEGKLSLAASGSKFTQAVTKLGNLIKTSSTEIRIRALHCLSNLIGYEQDPNVSRSNPVDHRVTLMTREWFRSLSTNPEAMEILQGLCKNPFPDIKLASFSLLDATCQHLWGEELVARTPGFIEYLLDRSIEHTKESKEVKFALVRRLSHSAAFDPTTMLKIKKYMDEGPFYTESAMEVVTED